MTDNIILLSEKSSGSSILQEELVKHSLINNIKFTKHTEAETLYWLKAANILGYPKHSFWQSKSPFPKKYSKKSIEYILSKNSNYLFNQQQFEVWEEIKNGWDALIDSNGPIFFEKSPHHLNQWPALACINRYVRESNKIVKFIGLVRNPLSVIYSTNQRWQSNIYDRQFFWENSYRNLLAMQKIHGDENLIIIRYEDLINSPNQILNKLFSFLGLKNEENIGKKFHSNSLSKWEKDPNFSFKLNESVMELGKQFGYTEEEMTCLKPNVAKRNIIISSVDKVIFNIKREYNFYRLHVLNKD